MEFKGTRAGQNSRPVAVMAFVSVVVVVVEADCFGVDWCHWWLWKERSEMSLEWSLDDGVRGKYREFAANMAGPGHRLALSVRCGSTLDGRMTWNHTQNTLLWA